jgi:hypothetical protein
MSDRNAAAKVRVRVSSAAPTLQRKCACGSSSVGASGTCANCAADQLFRTKKLQPKLRINDPGDAYEHEADQVAQDVMGSAAEPVLPRVPPAADSRLPTEGELRQGGEPLPQDVAKFYEPRFRRDFSAVRIHSGDSARRYNDAVNSYAFTYGNHIWLGAGLEKRPSHILAHELAHVVQQTQPPALSNRPRGGVALSPSPPSVQRYEPYWIPAEFIRKDPGARKKVGTPTHRLVLPKIGELNRIYTEAPVPNADKSKDGYYGIVGIADLYDATTTVGVYFDEERLPRELDSNRDLKLGGKPLERYGHIKKSAPRADEARQSVIRTADAPTRIAVGDLKPSHGTAEAEEGPKQVQNYLEGFKFARNEVNKLEIGTGGYGQTDAKWPSLTTSALTVKIPDEFKVATGGKGQESRALVQVLNGREVNAPPPVKGRRRQFVKGKVYVAESRQKDGILNYVWEPDTQATARTAPAVPATVTQMGTEVDTKLVKPLRASPVQTSGKRKPVPPAVSARPRLQKKPRDTQPKGVKDPFDKAAFEQWKTDHRQLTERETKLEKTPAFDTAESIALAIQDRQAAIRSGFAFPPITRPETAAVKLVDRIRFWTGLSSAIFGRLRYWFGGLFVKVVNAYHAIRARFQNLLKDRKGGPKKSGLLGTVIRIAFDVLKLAGRFLVVRTSEHLVKALKDRVSHKLKELIPEDKVEDFEAKVQELTDFAADLEQRAAQTVEAFIEKAVGPYLTHIETISSVAEKLGEVAGIVNKVRWGARVIACLSPPGWGCLWILAESVIEKFASWLIDKCWFKREIAPLITAHDFIAGLPKKLANFIIEGIRGLLPHRLAEILADKDVEQISTHVPPDEICDKNDFPPPGRDRALLEKLALQELRHEIGEEKWQAWTKLAERYGVNRADFLSEQDVLRLKKELQKASVTALREALELYPALSRSPKDVVNLTEFLERAEQVKQQMQGGGDGGSGGGGEGISVSASTQPKPGEYKPTKLGFTVVGGVTRGQYQGAIIKVDRGTSIKGVSVTLEGVEVRILKRRVSPKSIWVRLEVTKDQYFDIASKYGAEVVNKIGYLRFEIKRGVRFEHTLQLTEHPVGDRPSAPAQRATTSGARQ